MMALFKFLNVSFPVKNSLGGIHKSLSQQILSCLWYFMNIINSSMMVSSLTIIIAFLKQILLYIKAIQLILITVQRTASNPLSTSYCIADMGSCEICSVYMCTSSLSTFIIFKKYIYNNYTVNNKSLVEEKFRGSLDFIIM